MNHRQSQRKISIWKTNASDLRKCSSGPQLWKLVSCGTLWAVQIHPGAYWRVWPKTAKGRGIWGMRRSISEPSEWFPNWEHMNSCQRVCGCRCFIGNQFPDSKLFLKFMYLKTFLCSKPRPGFLILPFYNHPSSTLQDSKIYCSHQRRQIISP